jgi:hypothetical protein
MRNRKKRKTKPSKRKFYKTVIQVEILSSWPYEVPDSLGGVDQDITNSIDCVGAYHVVSQDELDGPQAAQALMAQEYDPSFFGLTAHGEDIGDG